MLPGLESRLEGLEAGATSDGVIPSSEAFGSESSQVKKIISRSEFPSDTRFAVGEKFAATGPTGDDIILKVIRIEGPELGDNEIEVALAHPLAESDIEYEVEVLEVTDPTPPPLPADAVAREEA